MNAELPPFKNGKHVYHRSCHNPFILSYLIKLLSASEFSSILSKVRFEIAMAAAKTLCTPLALYHKTKE